MALKVGIVRDDRFLLHQSGLVHPEKPGRLKTVYRMIEKDFGDELLSIEAEPATLEQLELVHTPAYVMKVLRTSEREFTYLASDTTLGARSYISAWLAVGGCLRGLRAAISGRCDVCFCLSRPPGHHALPDRGGGFCIFNNLGITAKYAVERLGYTRVLVIDWDITHGNGIQELFYDRKDVMYVSSHYTGWYPNTGQWEETGQGAGLGYTINLPVPKEIDDSDIVYLYAKVLTSVMRSYQPELILVAAGFNGHQRDPIGRTRLTEKGFRLLMELLLELRDPVRSPPVLLALEGGYDVAALTACIKEVLTVLTFKGRRRLVPVSLTSKGAELLEKAHDIHRRYRVWTV